MALVDFGPGGRGVRAAWQPRLAHWAPGSPLSVAFGLPSTFQRVDFKVFSALGSK